MSKLLNIDLRFNADTSAAKAQILSLQTSINLLSTGLASQGAQLGITPKIQEAQLAAALLKTALSQSMNVQTGKFDLSKFNSSLKSMNTDLGKLKTLLTSVGPQGQLAFMTLALSIMNAEIPTKRISASMAALGTTLKNTMKWQLSSSMLHGFMGAIRTSFNYALDLNKSLNNIRIVTGQSVGEMDKFAAKANRAAKALSASTLQYTDAALIFYQLGLKGKDVEERAEITLKMANVSRQSAEVVSDQLTAVWNNFADGTQTLESFADKMVALGAATASSSDEIAGGLEKFAAIGQTIGLSFDYAAAALATITSNTRQSEEVVGTALKTIFARIQGLKLGETLEDGVELNKYSQALAAIGVNIFDANKNLKDMDTILDETANKWGTLTKAQQTATAQTVAGIRQYNQFIALMDNWNDGTSDSMMANLSTVAGSNGALQKQADIYAESWEAASKRVKAAAEQIYSDLLNDDFFIDLTNGFGKFLELLDNFLDSMGGAKGLLTGLASILLTTFSGSAAKGLENMLYNFKSFVGIAQKEAMSILNSVVGMVKNGTGSGMTVDTSTPEGKMVSVANVAMEKQIELKHLLLTKGKELGEQEKMIAQYIIEQNEAMGLQLIEAQELANSAAMELNAARGAVLEESTNPNSREVTNALNNIDQEVAFGEKIKTELDKLDLEFLEGKLKVDEYVLGLKKLETRANFGDSVVKELDKLDLELQEGKINIDEYKNKLNELSLGKPTRIGKDSTKLGGYIKRRYTNKDGNEVEGINRERTLKGRANDADKGERTDFYAREDAKGVANKKHKNALLGVESKTLDKYTKSALNVAKANDKVKKTTDALNKSTDDASEKLNGLTQPTASWSLNLVGTALAAMSLSFAVSSLTSICTTWEDSTKSFGEKMLQTFMSLGMGVTMLVNGLKGLNTVTGLSIAIGNAKTVSMVKEVALSKSLDLAKKKEILSKLLGITTDEAGILISNASSTAKLKEALVTLGVANAEKKGILAKIASKAASLAVGAATAIMTAIKGAETVAVLTNTAAWYANPIMWIALVIAAVVVAIVGLITYFAFFNDTLSDNEQALADAQASLETLTAAYDAAKQKAEEFKEAVSNYEDGINSLKELEEGTAEYTDLLIKVNEAASELIKNFSLELLGSYEVTYTGLIKIDEEALKKIQGRLNDEVINASLSKTLGELKVALALYKVDKDNIIENSGYEKKYGNGTVNYLEEWLKHYEQLTKEQLQTTTKEDIADFLNNISDNGLDETTVIDMSDKLMSTTEKLDQLNTTQEANIEALQANTKALLKQKYGDLVDKYGEAAVYGAEQILTDKKKKNYKGTGKTAVAYFDNKVDGAAFNDDDIADSNLSEEDLKVIALVFGTDVSKIRDGEFDADDDVILTDNDNNVIGVLTKDEFNKKAAEITNPNTEKEIEGLLSTKEGLDAANKKAVKSGLYGEGEVRRETGTFAGITEEKALSLEKKDFGEYESEALKYFEKLPAEMKEGMSDALLKLSKDDIEKAGSVEKAMEKAENQEREKLYAALLNIDSDEFAQYTKNVQKNNSALADNEEAALNVAKAQIQLNRSIDKLGETYSDLKDDLDSSNKGTEEFYAACGKMADALGEVFDGAKFDSSFVEKNLDTIKKAMNGDIAAAQELIDLGGQEILIDAEININDGIGKEINDWIGSQEFNDIKIGTTLDDSGMKDKFLEMLDSGLVTADEMNEILKGIGYNPKIEEKEMEVSGEAVSNNDGTSTATVITGYDDNGNPITKEVTLPTKSFTKSENKTTVKVPIINGEATVKSVDAKTFASTAAKSSSGKGGGGGGNKKTVQKKAPIERKQSSEEIERYHEINQAIDKQSRLLDRLSAKKDLAYGVNRIKAIDKEIEALKKLNKLENLHLSEILYNLARDQLVVASYGATFDENGIINNYEAIMLARMDLWKAELDAILAEEIAYEEAKNNNEDYDADGAIKLDIETKKSQSDEDYEDFKEAMSSYEETMSLFEETIASILDRFNKMADLTIAKINEKTKQLLAFNADELSMLKLRISILGDSYSAFSEIVGLAAGKIDLLENSIKILGNALGQFTAQYEEGAITLDNFVAQIEALVPTFVSNVLALLDFDAEMMKYYAEAFEKASAEFSKYFNLIDYGIKKLDHYKSMLSLIGKESDKNMLNTVLLAQYKSANDRLKASTNWYETAKKEYDILYAKWKRNAELAADDEEKLSERELEGLESRLETALTQMREADSQRLSDLEATGKIAQEILQNNLDLAREKFEESLVGSSLEDYMTELDRLSKKQEEYLTSTNKMYETNKMIRQAQMAMDKTENKQAKLKYNDYIKYIGQLLQSGKLSQYELSIAQAKYDLLQAQIALEEAKEAKDLVRLTRDAEGNYGYVYTANEDKVSNAELGVADAENKLYNIGLDGAKDYESKKAATMQEALDTFADIEEQYRTGLIESEAEYEQKMAEAKEYYYGLLEEYDRLYYTALGVMQDESYDNTVDYELHSADVYENFKDNVDTYLAEVRKSFDDYGDKVQNIKDVVDPAMGGLAAVTEEVTEKTDQLADATYELAQEASDSLLSIGYLTEKWEKNRDEVYKNIEANYKYIESLREIQKFQLGLIEDYSEYLKGLVESGRGYDDRLVQEVLARRWDKMSGNDTYDYRQLQIDYAQLYANANNMSLEEAEKYLSENDAWYKTLEMMRNYKIEQTDWSAKKQEAIDNGASEDEVKWMDDMRDKKLNVDWKQRILQYVDWHKSEGITTADSTLQKMLGIRLALIDAGKAGSNPTSNEDLILGLVDAGYLIDISKTNQSERLDSANFSKYVTRVTSGEFGESEDAQKKALRALGVNEEDIEDIIKTVRGNTTVEEKHATTPNTDDNTSKKTNTETDKDKGNTKKDTEYRFVIYQGDKLLYTSGYNYNSLKEAKDAAKKWKNTTYKAENVKYSTVLKGSSSDTTWNKQIGKGKPKYAAGASVSSGGQERNPYIYDSDNGKFTWDTSVENVKFDKGTIEKIRYGTNNRWMYNVKVDVGRNARGNPKYRYYWLNDELIAGLDTGGYTGAWGPEGKIAMLHEKEIVLNKHDTENFLAATGILREISLMLNNNALIASLGAIDLKAMTLNSPADLVLQQEVTIHADFPNVTDHLEIEIAIDNLINAASQHAYKN